jgi:starch synthase
LAHGCQFVLLGSSPDSATNRDFWQLKHQFNDNPDCHLELSYNEELAHLIYAGADMILIPSAFEPCGLTQMIAMKYGTVPIVRRTGGLADSVRHFDPATGEGTGIVFNDFDPGGVRWALATTLDWFAQPSMWRRLQLNGMREDFSWDRQVAAYEALYQDLAAAP